VSGLYAAKEIKAGKLRVDVFRLELLSEVHKVARLMRADLEANTATWKHQPKWKENVSLRGGSSIYMELADDSDAATIYKYVDRGTRPHEIWAGFYTGKSSHKTLAFPSVSTPKTQPNTLGSGPGGSSGPTVMVPHVDHPGTAARNFTDMLQQKWQPLYKRHMEDAMRRAAAKCGHGRQT
jgi:hypothetical protein